MKKTCTSNKIALMRRKVCCNDRDHGNINNGTIGGSMGIITVVMTTMRNATENRRILAEQLQLPEIRVEEPATV